MSLVSEPPAADQTSLDAQAGAKQAATKAARSRAQRLPTYAFWISLGILAVCATALYHFYVKNVLLFFWPQTAEAIYVDSPEVYTRERLINERLDEESWLLAELDAARSFTPTVLRIEKVGVAAELVLGQISQAGGTDGTRANPTAPKAEPDPEGDNSKDQTDKKDENLPAAQGIGADETVNENFDPATDGLGADTLAEDKPTDQKPVAPQAGKKVPNGQSGSATDKSGSAIGNSAANQTASDIRISGLAADQVFKLRSAHRSVLRQRLIENRLDDRHDLSGNSLYILKFDTTVFSVPALRHQARVHVKLFESATYASNPKDDALPSDAKAEAYFEDLYNEWIVDLQRRLNVQVKAAVNKLIYSALSEAAASKLFQQMEQSAPGAEVVWNACMNKSGESAVSCLHQVLRSPVYHEIAIISVVGRTIAEVIGAGEDDLRISRADPTETSGRYVVYFRNSFSPVNITFTMDVVRRGLPVVTVSEAVADFRWVDQCGDDAQIAPNGLVSMVEGLREGTDKFMSASLLAIQYFEQHVKPDLEKAKGDNVSGTYFAAWNVASYKASEEAPAPSAPQEIAVPGSPKELSCKRDFLGAVRTGLQQFSSQVNEYVSFSYSVLPRENPIAIRKEIQREVSASSSGWLGYELGGSSKIEGHDLMPVLSTFADTVGPIEKRIPRVGWVIAPSVLYGDEADSLASVSESVLAIVSVPAWWSSLHLEIETQWLDHWGNILEGSVITEKEILVDLPNNQALLDSLVFAQKDRGPVISDWIVQQQNDVCDAASVLIIGQRLWRNTSVTVGSVKADRIAVLPDMSAVIATFSSAPEQPLTGRLIVWTSEGFAEATETVVLKPSDRSCSK